MKWILFTIGLLSLLVRTPAYSQSASIDPIAFFNDSSVLQATLVTNLDKILSSHRKKHSPVPGVFKTTLSDGQTLTGPVVLRVRGNFRLDFCYVPPIKIKFSTTDSSVLRSLKSLDLITACKSSQDFEQYLLKEYLIYKIYNVLTEKSFHVRLLNLNLQDSAGKKKPLNIYAFLQEDVKDLAKRNGYREMGKGNVKSPPFDRQQVAMVSIFEYMIGNLDWGLSPNHNVKLILSSRDSAGGLEIIPYDFDYAGFVNAHYSVSNDPELENVKQRKYIGVSRTMAQLEEVLSIFRQRKARIYDLINHFELLTVKNRKEIIDYLDEFYGMIGHPAQVKSNFTPDAAQ